jgi:hypothetical protein
VEESSKSPVQIETEIVSEKRKNRITFGGAVCLEKYKTIDFYTFLRRIQARSATLIN